MDDDLQRGLNDLDHAADLANQELQRMAADLKRPVSVDGIDPAPGSQEKTWTAKLKSGVKIGAEALGTAAGAVSDFSRAVNDGGDAFENMDTLAEGAVDAISDIAGSTSRAAEILQAVSGAAKILHQTLTQQKQTWQQLSQVGASGAAGLRDIQRQYLASELDIKLFSSAVSSTSESLAQFRGTVSQGTDDFAVMLRNLNQGDLSLRRIGMTPEEITGATSSYLAITASTGQARNMTVAQMTAGAKNYGLQLDMLARLTGESREALAKGQREELLQNDRLMALVSGTGVSATEIQAQFDAVKSQYGETAAKGFVDVKAGNRATAEAQYWIEHFGTSADFSDVQTLMESTSAEYRKRQSMFQAAAITTGSEGIGAGVAKITAAAEKDYSQQAAATQQQREALEAKDKQTEATIEAEKEMQHQQFLWNEQMTKFLPVYADINNIVADKMKWVSDQVVNLGPTVEKITGLHLPSMEGAYESIKGAFGGGEASGSAILDQAKSMLGKTETGNRSELIDYLNQNSGTQMRDVVGEAYAWCARYVNATLGKLGIEGTHSASAASFKSYGESVWDRSKGNDLSNVRAGDIIVIQRDGGSGSHVAFVEGIDQATGKVKIVGGNQGGSRAGGGGVTESSVSIADIQAIRRAPGADKLATAPVDLSKNMPVPNTEESPPSTQTVNVVTEGLGEVKPFPAKKPESTTPETPAVPSTSPPPVAEMSPVATEKATAATSPVTGAMPVVSDLTVPNAQTAAPPTAVEQLGSTTTASSTNTAPTISFQETIMLLQSVSSRLDELERTTQQQLAMTETARKKAKV